MTGGHPLAPRAAPWLWAAVALSAFALGRTACSFWPVTPLAEQAGFDEAVAWLVRETDPQSLVVVWPPEQARALAALPPGLRAADAVPAVPAERRQFLTLHVLGPAGFASPPELRDATPVDRRRFGAVEVGYWRYAGNDRVDFDLRAGLAETIVRLDGPEGVACNQARPDGGFACPGRPEWNHVAPTSLRVDGEEWPCVWMHPVSGHDLVVDLGERTLFDRVEVEAALHDDAVTTPGGAAVVIRLEVEGLPLQRLTRTNNRGIARLTLPTVPHTRQRVRLVVSTTNDGRRHLGLNLRIVEARRADSPTDAP
jgi:hypothetical protein